MISEEIKETFLAIKEALNNDSYRHPEFHLEDMYESIFEDYTTFKDDEWSDEGKYQYMSPVYEITTLGGEKFLIEVSIARSGSYFSDYDYSVNNVEMVTHSTKEVKTILNIFTPVKF